MRKDLCPGGRGKSSRSWGESRKKRLVYKLQDLKGEDVDGWLYPEMLRPHIGVYNRAKVIEKVNKRNRQGVNVKYLGWPEKFNETIPLDKYNPHSAETASNQGTSLMELNEERPTRTRTRTNSPSPTQSPPSPTQASMMVQASKRLCGPSHYGVPGVLVWHHTLVPT